MNINALVGSEVRLIPLSTDHAEALFPSASDPEVWRWMPRPRPKSVTQMRAMLSQMIADPARRCFAVQRIAVVSGPNLAAEVVDRKPAASVVACADESTAALIQGACHTPYFRPYTNTDVIGCELGGAIKNVIALAVGITGGMKLKDNAKAALVTRGLAEATRLGAAMGADPLTLAGLAGMGDLIATCSSTLSRNHTFGAHLGRGLSVEEARAATPQTAEGVASCKAIQGLAERHDVEMPITRAVVDIIHGGRKAARVVQELMSRATKPENLQHRPGAKDA
ncbi:NAD(P)H-dependent glycerol-3-phosphate dehydrogenase [Streptomyces sp. NPDC007856]|uniref:NAD(P)H-dependent glycerol-3-phosphate dehydrogenase n=1 Tax=Streptomyces sp. NPDC007856 TaxID=3364781 RepID=UPI0036BA3DCF